MGCRRMTYPAALPALASHTAFIANMFSTTEFFPSEYSGDTAADTAAPTEAGDDGASAMARWYIEDGAVPGH